MIKINLVAEGRKPVVKRVLRSRGEGSKALVGEQAALVSLVLTVLVFGALLGGWWWMLRGTIAEHKQQVRVAERRVNELEEIIRQVEEFEIKQATLEQKIDVITRLKNSQRGPVEIMDQIARALPELLWLDRLDQSGNQITLSGRAFNSGAIEAFIKSLDESPAFDEPKLNDITQRNDVYIFTLVLTKVTATEDTPA